MKVLPPIKIDDTNIVSTNVPEDDAPAWLIGTTYANKDRVIVVATHSVYESLQDGNTGNNPTDAVSPWWVRVMATKPRRAFDGELSAPVIKSGKITYVIAPAVLTRAVALVGVSAATAKCTVKTAGGTTLVTRTLALADYTELIDALTMVTVMPGRKENAIFEDVICQPGNRVHVEIGDGSGSTEVSEILIGDTITIGTATFGTDLGITDYSRFDEDDFGNISIVKRGYRDRTTFQVALPTGDVERLRRRLAQLRASFALYYHTATGRSLGTTVYGRYQRLDFTLEGPNMSKMELEVLGVVSDGN